ncbi:MAG TPA: hypothetical protein VGX96_19555 [Candidatus Elarobacter sp.]|jgi:hypothetical protein|nr:hypothetical protein [Candidatus Elarobacter sp.]
MASPRSIAKAAEDTANKARKEAEGVKAQSAAVAESARIRAMFAEDRSKLEKRYGVISARSMSSESTEK